jgi:hypothetical protein
MFIGASARQASVFGKSAGAARPQERSAEAYNHRCTPIKADERRISALIGDFSQSSALIAQRCL